MRFYQEFICEKTKTALPKSCIKTKDETAFIAKTINAKLLSMTGHLRQNSWEMQIHTHWGDEVMLFVQIYLDGPDKIKCDITKLSH